MLPDKKILLCVTGSIAAYKIPILVRLLIKEKAEVKVILTPAATAFVTPTTLSTLSKNPVYIDFVKENTGEWNNHVELGLWADLIIIAPASANTLAKCAHGQCDNLLLATYLSAKCPVFIAPAMDLDMYQHPSTQNNLTILKSYGNLIIPAEHGELASGLVGEGRMAEPAHIVAHIKEYLLQKETLKGKNILVTAGPTHEAIDPVRFISNHSTGKMGYAIAEQLAARGAKVYLISGPTQIALKNIKDITLIKINTAAEMLHEVEKYFALMDIIVLAAAVADYTPQEVATQKIKKKEESLQLNLTKTVDIAATIGKRKQPHQTIIGFALETNNELANAKQKLQKKNFDFIVLNSLQDAGAGFGHDTNKITILDKKGKQLDFPLKSKQEVANDIVNLLIFDN